MQKRTWSNLRRIVTLVIAMALLVTSFPLPAFAAPLEGISEDASFEFASETMVEATEAVELPCEAAAFSATELSLTFGGSPGTPRTRPLVLGEMERLFIDGQRSGPSGGALPIDAISFDYSDYEHLITVDANGSVSLVEGARPAKGTVVRVSAEISYFPEEYVLFYDNFSNGVGQWSDTGGMRLLQNSILNTGNIYRGYPASRTGRFGVTTATSANSSPIATIDGGETGTIVFWYYDPGTDIGVSGSVPGESNIQLMVNITGEPWGTGLLGISYGSILGNNNSSYYYSFRGGLTAQSQPSATPVRRSQGWRRFEYRVTETGTTVHIDGVQVGVTPNTSIQGVQLALNWATQGGTQVHLSGAHFIDDIYAVRAGATTRTTTIETSFEIATVGEDIAPLATTVIASNELSTHPGRQAVNGNLGVRWATAAPSVYTEPLPLTLELVFDDVHTVYYAGISAFQNGAVRIQDFSVEYYTATGWQEAYRRTGPLQGGSPAPAPTYLLFDAPVTSDRFRFAIHAFDIAPSIWAFQLFDAAPNMPLLILEDARVNHSPIGANQTLAFLEATAVRMAEPGTRLTVTAAPPPAGYVFDRWETEGLTVGVHATELHMRQARFPFTMPDNTIRIRPVYRPHGYDLRVGLTADIHVGQTRAELGLPLAHRFTSMADWFTTQGLDAIGIAGDVTRTSGSGNTSGVQADFNTIRNIVQGRFDTPRYPTADAPQLMVSLGNHCSPGQGSRGLYNALGFGSSRAVRLGGDAPGEGYWFLAINAGATQAGEAAFMDDHVRGFHMGGNSSGQTYTCPQMRAWMRRYIDLAAENEEPIFLFLHHAIQNTVYVSHEWNTSNFGSNINNWYFRNDPHVVIFTGHTHAPNNDPRSIWQMPGGFTVVNLMSTEFLEMENRGTRNQQFIGNNAAGTGTSTRPRHRYNATGNNTHVGASTMEISGTTITIRNFDFSMEGGLNDSVYEYYNQVWSFDVMDFNDRPYTNDRAQQAQAPVWEAFETGGTPYISVRDIGYTNVTVEFEQPVMPTHNPVNETVHSYRFVFRNLDTGEIDRTAWQWSDFMFPTRQQPTYTQMIGGLRRATNYRLEIHAYGSFQRESEQYLTIDFRTEGEAEPARTYSLSFDGHLNNETGRNPGAVQTVSNLAGNVVQPRFEPGSQPDRQAIRLDRENFINLGPEPDVFDYNNSFTIAYRINVLERTGNFGIILGNKNYASGGNNGFVFLVRNGQAPNGYILLNTTSGGNRLNGMNDIRIAYAHVGDNDIWIHIAVVYCFDTNTVSYYADGERVGRRNHNLQAGMNGQRNTMIGQVTNGTALYANASNNSTFLMEDFLLTPGAMTSEAIYALANPQEDETPTIVSVGAQVGAVTEGEAGTASFDVQTRHIPVDTAIALNGAPAGISLLTTATAGDLTTVAIAVEASVSGGRYPVTLTIGGVTSTTFYVTVLSDLTWGDGFVLPFDGDLRNLANNPLELSVRNRAGETQTPNFVPGSRPGRQAIELHGESFIDLGLNPIDYSEDFSIAFRVNAISQQGMDGTWAPPIVSNKNWNAGGNPGWAVAVRGNANTNRRIRLNNTSTGTGGNRQDWYVGTANDLLIGNNDNWMHVAFAFDFAGGPNETGSITTYVNGQPFNVFNQNFASGMITDLNTLLGNAHANAANGSFYNGGTPGGAARNMTMHIEDFVLIPGLLTAEEVALLEQEGLAEPTDFTALETLITYAEDLDATDFTPESWVTLAPAITAATAVRNNGNATQGEVDAAVTVLQGVIDALVTATNFTALTALITYAEDLDATDFTPESWATLAPAITAAETVRNNGNATQGEVDAAVTALQGVIDALVAAANFTALAALITYAEDLDATDFTPESWATLAPAITAAETVQNNANATQGEVDAAVTALQGVIDALIAAANFTALAALITYAEDLDATGFTPESWATLAPAITAATAVRNNGNATQAEVNAAVTALQGVIDALVAVANFTALVALIAYAEDLDATDFTPESWATLAPAITAATAVRNNGNATQAEVNAAVTALQGVIDALVAATIPTDFTVLAALIAYAEDLDATDFTPESWATLAPAITAAEVVRNNANATQAEVNAAVTALQGVIDALVAAANFTALAALITYAEDLDATDFTPASWVTLAPAITAAEAVRNNANATQGEVDAAVTALQAVIDALVAATVPTDFTALEALITYAEDLDASAFTPASWATLAPAITAAEAVRNNGNATQAEVDAAVTALQRVIDALAAAVPTYGITLSVTGTHNFPAATVGYDAQRPLTVTVTNTGNQPTGTLTVAVGAGFTRTPATIPSIAAGGTATFTVVPNMELTVGTHTATVAVDGTNVMAVNFTVSFTVQADTEDDTEDVYEVHSAYMFGSGGNFRPRAAISRAEVATILARTQLLDFEQGIQELPPGMERFDAFSDVEQGDWFFYYVAWVYDAGLIQGYRGRFRPNAPITREELAAILARTTSLQTGQTSFLDASTISNWAQDYVYTVYRAGWITGDDQNRLRPTDNIVRAEVATVINRILGRLDSRAAFDAAEIEYLERATAFPDVAASAWYFPSVLAAANDHHLSRADDNTVSWKYIVG